MIQKGDKVKILLPGNWSNEYTVKYIENCVARLDSGGTVHINNLKKVNKCKQP